MSGCPACKVAPVESPRIPHFNLDGGECKCQDCTIGKGPKEALEEKVRKALPPHFFRTGADQVFEPYPKTEPVPAAQVVRSVSPLREWIIFNA